MRDDSSFGQFAGLILDFCGLIEICLDGYLPKRFKAKMDYSF